MEEIRRGMKNKIISTLLIGALIAVSITGCGGKGKEKGEVNPVQEKVNKMSKSQLRSEYMSLYDQYTNVCQQYDDLQTVLHGIQNEEAPSAAIGIAGDGTGRFTFNSTDSKIIFPSTFQYPNAEPIAPSGNISVVDDVTVKVNSTWIYKLTGSALEMEHSSGISGTIKVAKISTNYTTDLLQTDVLEPWFSNLPPSSVQYTKIFINNKDYGMQAKTTTMIDSEDAYLTCGMVGFGTYTVTYIFVYRGDQDPSKDESIHNVINSISINKNSLLVGEN